MRMIRRTTILTLAVMLLLGACADSVPAPEPTEPPELPDIGGLTLTWGCGFGFWLGNTAQTVALRVEAHHDGSAPIDDGFFLTTSLPDPNGRWSAELILGRDLYANWCDDAIEEDEPIPVVDEVWDVVSGTIEAVFLPPGPECSAAEAWVRDVSAMADDGRVVEIGELRLTNTAWGCFAG